MPITADTLRKYLTLSKFFIETGTEGGMGIRAALDAGFETIWSVDIDPDHTDYCAALFADEPAVTCFCAHSVDFLIEKLPLIAEPATFWLDAHPSDSSPILE